MIKTSKPGDPTIDTTPKATEDQLASKAYPYTVAVPGLPFKYVMAKVELYKMGGKGDIRTHLGQYYMENPKLKNSQGLAARNSGGVKGFLQGTGIAGC